MICVDANNGERCPGERECEILKQPGESPEETCPGCLYYKTKPGYASDEVTSALRFAMDHEAEVTTGGYRIHDKNVLTPFQWAAIRGLTKGRNRYDEESEQIRKQNSQSAPTLPAGYVLESARTR